nr:Gfo/Idh/MocA family oxidoreductase [Pseudomonadota bacterium]
MNNKIKTAVVGVGYLGTFHAEKYSTLENSELIAVVDVRKEQVDKISTKLNVKGLNDYKELKDLGVQAVSVAADTTKHFEIASWLLSNGIDVLLEKPIASNVEEAQKLVEIAETNQRILQVGHLERFNPAFIEMKRVLTKPWFFESKRISSFTGRGSDVDVVLDLMIHDIDIISHLVGRPLERVDAVGVPVLTKSVDIANARLIFEGGATANVTASRVSFKSERSMRIFQPDVYINLDFGNKKLKIFTKSSADPGATPQI